MSLTLKMMMTMTTTQAQMNHELFDKICNNATFSAQISLPKKGWGNPTNKPPAFMYINQTPLTSTDTGKLPNFSPFTDHAVLFSLQSDGIFQDYNYQIKPFTNVAPHNSM